MSITPGVALGAEALSSLISSGGNIISTAMANSANRELYEDQKRYNDPKAVYQRLKNAGLNPALMYGKGPGAFIAGSPPEMRAPSIEKPNFSGALSNYQQIHNMELQSSNISAQNKVLEAQAVKEAAEAMNATMEANFKQKMFDKYGFTIQKDDKITGNLYRIVDSFNELIGRFNFGPSSVGVPPLNLDRPRTNESVNWKLIDKVEKEMAKSW